MVVQEVDGECVVVMELDRVWCHTQQEGSQYFGLQGCQLPHSYSPPEVTPCIPLGAASSLTEQISHEEGWPNRRASFHKVGV